MRRQGLTDAGEEIPVLCFLAQQSQRHRSIVEKIDRSIAEGGSARKDSVGVGWSRLGFGHRCKRLERCSLHNRGEIEPRAVAVEFESDGLAALRL